MKKYIVYDTTDSPVSTPFNTYKDAETYKIIHGRPDWIIKLTHTHIERKSTEKQRKAILFIEKWCHVTFEGDINDFYEVSDFLADYLDTAKEVVEDTVASYYSMLNGY